MNLLRTLFFLGLFIVVLSSCQKEFEPGATSTVKISNDYWANLYLDGEPLYSTFKAFHIYNSSLSSDSIWVDDDSNLWEFKVKCKADLKNLTFATTNAPNEYYSITATITDGKVLPLAGHSKSGKATDSLYMKVVFSDDPETTYEIKGTARTKFKEDEY
jgi:hypothetical protein